MESGPPQPPYQGTLDCFEVFAPSPPDARFQNVNTSGGPMNNINQVDLEQLAPYNPLQDSSYYYFQPPHQIQQQQNQQQMQFGMSQQTPSHRILQQPPNITMQMQQHQMAVPVPHHQQHIMPSGSGHIPNIQAPQMQAPMIIGIPPQQQKRKEIYRYTAPYNLYATSWSCRPDPHLKFRLAVGSFIEEYNNKISIIQLHEEQGEFAHIGTFDHPYPATRVLWVPDQKGTYPDLLATTGDYLRLWRVGGHHGASLEVLLNNNRSSEYCAPLTSADWNEIDPSLIGTSSIDTTCTIWQIETGQAIANTQRAIEGNVKTQLIAHDKEVYDIEFSKLANGREIFASVGADGSVRMFDLRHMEYSTIVFEEPNRKPLLRLAWNKQDHNYLATFAQNSTEVFILDIRIPSMPIATLKNHTACVNGIAWAPHSSCHICTAADDCQALIWDVHQMPRPVEDPILAYAASGENKFGKDITRFINYMNNPFEENPSIPSAPADFDNPPEPNSPSSSTQATAASSVGRLTDFEVSSSTLSDLPSASSVSALVADPATPSCTSSQEVSDPVVSRPHFSIGVVAASAQSSSNDLELEDISAEVPFEPSNNKVPAFEDIVSSTSSSSANRPNLGTHNRPAFELPSALEPETFQKPEPEASSSSAHPSDPVKPPAVNPVLLSQVLELGFAEYIAEVAIRRTGGVGVEQAINWIIDHSNASDIEDEDDDMGANESTPATSNNAPNDFFGSLLRAAIPRTHKMVFVANMSLKMGVGKLAAQVGHATLGVYRTAMKTQEGQAAIEAWRRHGEVKIVVKGNSTEHLLDLFKVAKDLNLHAYLVQDAGYTQIPAGSRTVLGIFGPQEVVDQVTGSLKLL